jgi:hypothetical protein
VELKTIKGIHYLYKVKSVYDPDKKRAKKISGEYLGRVTREGLTPPKNRARTIHEYGNANLLSTLMKETETSLKENFRGLEGTHRPSHNQDHQRHTHQIRQGRLA